MEQQQNPTGSVDDTARGKPGLLETHKEPLFWCRLVARRPRLCFGAVLGVHVLLVLVSVVLVLSGYDLFPVDFGTLPLHLNNQPWRARELAWRGRPHFKGFVRNRMPVENTHRWPRSERWSKSPVLLYDAGPGGNVFTRAGLKTMQRIEQRLERVGTYEKFCQLTQDHHCFPTLSVLRFFDGTFSLLNPALHDPEFREIPRVMHEAYTSNVTRGLLLYGLGKGYVITPTRVSISVTRSVLPLGEPLYGMNDSQKAAAEDFLATDLQPKLDGFLDTAQLRFLYFSEPLMLRDAKLQGFKDMALTAGSVAFIVAFVLFHTRSLFTTGLGVFSIICSFVEANLVYRVILGFRYFGFFHVLAMFIILGIGADDLFVFWDAWRATDRRRFPSLAHRLDATYRASAVSMLVTSLTTTLAFAAAALSPLLATNSFGVFSAVLVVIDYVSVITFFPTIVVMHHLHFEGACCSCCKPKVSAGFQRNYGGAREPGSAGYSRLAEESSSRDVYDDFGDEEDDIGDATARIDSFANEAGIENVQQASHNNVIANRNTGDEVCLFQEPNNDMNGESYDICLFQESTNKDRNRVDINNDDEDDDVCLLDLATPDSRPTRRQPSSPRGGDGGEPGLVQPETRRLVVFFSDHYLRLVTHRVLRWPLLVVFLAMVTFFTVSASRLVPDNQQVGLFRESHHHTQAFRLTSNGFVSGSSLESSIQLILQWGLRANDLSGCHFSDYNCKGHIQHVPNFNPSTQQAQLSLMKLCDTLSSLSKQEADDLRIRRDVISGKMEIKCFTKHIDNFFKSQSRFAGMDVAMPWDGPKVTAFMSAVNESYNSSLLTDSYRHYLDVPVNYWIWDGFRQTFTQDFQDFNDLMGEERTPFSTPALDTPSLLVGNRLRWVAVQVGTSLQYETLSYTEHIPVLQRWESFMQGQLKSMPAEMQGGFQLTQVAWHWLYVQQTLVHNAVTGVVLGLGLALPILVVSTCNVVNGVLATLTICCVTACVIGVVPLAGWKLGVLVSLNMCLVVGLAVDYVVHLAEGYHMSPARDRKSRLKHALERMGTAVFSGACTTLGASAFLLFAQIQFFFQFGIFMFCTIGFSLVFSMGLYVTVMGIVGPEGDFGDIRVPLRASLARLGYRRLKH